MAILEKLNLQLSAYVARSEQVCRSVPGVTDRVAARPIASAGVVGAGTMGVGIAMACANAGIAVTLVDVNRSNLDRGCSQIRASYARGVARGKISSGQAQQRAALIVDSTSMQALAGCDMIIEAVFERMDLKQQVFAALDGIAKAGAVLATNTSGLNIDEIAAATRRPQSVIGLHFASPAHVMRLLEVVRAGHTSDEVIATCMAFAGTLGKIPILVRVCPGFVGNRTMYRQRQALDVLLLEGAMPWDIDRVLREFGFPMGPFEMSDLAGLDIGWDRESSRGASVRELLCEQGRFGQKTQAGFYDYPVGHGAQPSPVTEVIVRDFAAAHGRELRQITDAEILQRCIVPVINEGARILEEGVAMRASDIDVIWRGGFGWPTQHGGPMWYADRLGLHEVLAQLSALERALGAQFAPAPLLERLSAEGGQLHTFEVSSAAVAAVQSAAVQ